MLKSLRFENFQIWDNLFLELDPGINAIIGPSDRGKSSVLRGLYWLAMNDPSGDEFMNHDAKYCLVEGVFTGGIVQRFRSAKENKYIINGKDFSTVRTGVPREAREIMGLTDTNFQMQDDPFFLIGLSNAGEVAKKLNQVVGLNLIDTSISYPDKIVRKMNSKIKLYEAELKGKKEKLERYENLDEILELNEELETWEDKLQVVDGTIESLNRRTEELISRRSALKRYDSIAGIDRNLRLISKFEKDRQKNDFATDNLQKSIRVLQLNRKFINNFKRSYKKLTKTDEELNNLILEWSENDTDQIEKIVEEIQSKNRWLIKRKKVLKAVEAQYEDLKTELEVCPVCGSALKPGLQ